MRVTKLVEGGETRCVQAAYRMVIHALAGEDPGFQATDEITGYVEGRGTWQFRMLLGFAAYGFHVVDHEEFDVQGFLQDPGEAILAQVSDKAAADAILAETDIEAESTALRRCVATPLITFRETIPTLDDLRSEIDAGRLVLINVNRRVLQNRDGREGHILILEAISETNAVVHDPGPGGGLGIELDTKLLFAAWTSPSERMANYISVSKT